MPAISIGQFTAQIRTLIARSLSTMDRAAFFTSGALTVTVARLSTGFECVMRGLFIRLIGQQRLLRTTAREDITSRHHLIIIRIRDHPRRSARLITISVNGRGVTLYREGGLRLAFGV